MTTKEQVMDEMKEWLLDCFNDDYDQEDIMELTYDECVRVVNRYYHGGMKAFVECNNLIVEA